MRRRIISRNVTNVARERKSAPALLLFAAGRNLEIRGSVIFIRFQESLTSGAPAKRFYRFSTRSTPPLLPNPLPCNTGGFTAGALRIPPNDTSSDRPDLTVKTRRLPGLRISPRYYVTNLKFRCSRRVYRSRIFRPT